jgi:type II secretory pathway component PulC
MSRVDPKILNPAENRAESKSPAISGPPPSPVPAGAKPANQEVAPPPPSNEPVREARGDISQIPPKVVSSAESKAESKDLAAVQGEKKTSQKVIPEEASVVPGNVKKAPEPAPKESSSNPPSLKLSGILWHEEPSERRAMINGMILSEGSIFEGVKVLEIHPTYVRLSHNGRPFEVSINILNQ